MCRNIWSISVAAFAGHQRRQKQMECSETELQKLIQNRYFPMNIKLQTIRTPRKTHFQFSETENEQTQRGNKTHQT
jgi:hypothetical protein